MESFRIEILNPKAKKLLKDLADLNLIKITRKKEVSSDFLGVVEKLRNQSQVAPSFEEIIREVEDVRQARYGKK